MHLLDLPMAYRAWQAPFAAQKLVPLLRRHGGAPGGRVLDVACGPGTNAGQFRSEGYLGIDINEAYIKSARRRHGPRFQVADATTFTGDGVGSFDMILINSFLHHLSDSQVRMMLQNLIPLLASRGVISALELVRPDQLGLPRLLAALDRGRFARPTTEWRALLSEPLELRHVEPYVLRGAGLDLWSMVYIEGTPR